MQSIKKHHYLIAFMVIAVVVAGSFLFFEQAEAPVSEPERSDSQGTEEAAIVMLTIGENYTNESIPYIPETSVLQLLIEVSAQESGMELDTETYDGLGTLVTGMFGRENGEDDSYWQYEVNGEMPQIGADQYIVDPGDDIVWTFGASTY